MRKKHHYFSFIIVSIAILLNGIANVKADRIEPMNLNTLKKELIQYHDSGTYEQGIAQVVMQAKHYLQQRVAENNRSHHPKKLAAVFDIDETSLSNYADMKFLDFGGTPQMIDAAIDKARDPVIVPTLDLYRLAKRDGVAIFFITGRHQRQKTATVENLRRAGYTTWAGLSLKPNDYNRSSVVPYKSGERAKIEQSGYDIILNIGDQNSDLAAGYADKTFKLPDPYYFIP